MTQPRKQAVFRYTAKVWPDDAPSHAAWKAIMVEPHGVSCWRWAFPLEPPHTGWVVAVMGEDADVIRAHEQTLLDHGGQPYNLDADMVGALRMRRLGQAARAAETGEWMQVAEGQPRVLDRSGRMTPYRRRRP